MGTGGAIPGTSTTQTCFSQNVTGVGVINGTLGLASVCINLTHPNDDELEIVLTAPDGTVVPLSIQNGGSGNNYITTCFTATATTPIKFGTAPFNGAYLPEGYLGAVNNGQNANGVWRLCIQDRRTAGNAGTLNNWTLSFNSTPAPAPPTLPACANTLPSNSSCATAALVCDFNGQCGSTSGTTVQDWTGSGLDGCFGLQNNSFIRFIASATTASFSVWVPSTTQASYNQGGIQMLFFSGTCNSGPVTTFGCYPHILPYSGTGQPLITVVTAAGLTPGNTYYLMIDGFNNDNCNFTIAANTGVNILNVTPAAPVICEGSSVNLTASGGNGIYSWSPATNLNTTTGATVIANPPATTTYTITSTTVTGCPITKDVTVAVSPLPPAPTVTVSPSSCVSAGGSITVTSPAGMLYSLNGGPYQSSPVFNLLPANSTHTVTVQSAASCISAPLTITIPAASTIPIPTGILTQPTCSNPTGSILITSTSGTGITYSLNGGPFLPGALITALTPNSYTVVVATGGGCISPPSAPFVINPPPVAPTLPTGNIIQPVCSFPFGQFVFNTPVGSQYEYSINGTAFQTSTVFTNIPSGNYNAVVRDINTGCVSQSFPFTINAVPLAPAAPTVTYVQPNCGSAGSITITSPLGPDYEYSVNNGPYQSSPVFNGLSGIPSPTEVRVRSISGSCISNATPVPLVASPLPQPFLVNSLNCQAPPNSPSAGQISFITPLGADYEYSINGGTSYQPGPVFNNLPHASHTVTYRVISTGCVAAAQIVTLSGIPAPSTFTFTQPATCNSGGTVTVIAPLGNQYAYQLLAPNGNPGMPWQPSPVFNNVPPGTYTLIVGMGQCLLLNQTTIVITAAVTQPGPLSIATVQPTCTTATGSINITPPAGSNLEFSVNGASYQSSTSFNNLAPGTYNVTVKNNVTGCVSPVTPVTLNAAPATPAVPTGSVTVQPDCDNSGGTITITAPLGNGYEYSVNGGTTFQTSPLFTNLAPNIYNVVVKASASGCISQVLSLTVINGPVRPQQPAMSTVQPACNSTVGSITITAPLGAGLQYNVNSGPYQSSTVFDNLPEGIYLVTVKDATGCVSHISTAIILESAGVPTKPVLTITQPTCPARLGAIKVTAPVGTNIEYSINGNNYQSSNTFSNLAGGNYNVTARFTGTPCISPASTAQLNMLTPEQCLVPADGDIYFPSAFTPNGDGINDGFGPGPRSNLLNVTGYTLTLFNRYGEKVFESTDPLLQWNGMYKGKMLANYSFTWVAQYRYGSRPVQVKKGSVMVLR